MGDVWMGIMSICITTVIMVMSLLSILRLRRSEFSAFSWKHFSNLFMVYLILIIGFAIIYLSIAVTGKPSVASHSNIAEDPIHFIANLIYFSGITMLSVGYGDIVPVGISKLFAVAQALIGYLLPAAFIVSGFVISMDKKQYMYEKEHMDKR